SELTLSDLTVMPEYLTGVTVTPNSPVFSAGVMLHRASNRQVTGIRQAVDFSASAARALFDQP
ncbi:MAG: hypothetical protein ACPH3H_09675, partial [Pseudomonadales bacterium]